MILKRFLLLAALWLVFSPLELSAQFSGTTQDKSSSSGLTQNTVVSATSSITLLPGFSTNGYDFHALINSCVPLAASLSANQNYMVTYTPREAFTDAASLAGKDVCQVMQQVQYFDGLGRPIQTVQTKGSPGFKDIVQPVAYDAFGREASKYLPYASSVNNGSYKADALQAGAGVFAFYNSPPAGVVQIPGVPFAETRFELSPLNRVLEQGAPGALWKLGSGHTVETSYGTNIASEVRLWTISGTSSTGTSFYQANQLYKTTVSDENKNKTIEFKDKEGRVVLKQAEEPAGTFLSTYYVYDDFGNLRYVIPPGVTATSFSEADATFNNYIYGYHYDERQRVIEKKIPGKGWEYLVYNKLDQVVMSQDANQRAKAPQEWSITKYDAFGRVVITGLWSNTAGLTIATIKANVNSATQWETPTTTGNGYTASTYPTSWGTTLVINYYDNYDFPGNPYPFTQRSNMTKGLHTGSRTKVLNGTTGTTDMLWNVLYYDDKGQVVKSFSQHYKGGTVVTGNYDEITNTYNFPGELTSSTRSHKVAGAETVKTVTEYEYDHMGRKKNTWEKINSGTRTLLAQNNYNEVGQLMDKKLHSTDQSSFVQSVDYRYNERGWLKSINNASLSNDGVSNDDAGDIFGMELVYGNKADAFNGNIGSMKWQTKVPSGLGLSQIQQSYDYSYDKLNRLILANYTTAGLVGKFNEQMSYDKMGNIKTLKRKNNVSGYLNDLSYDYTSGGAGNKLWGITDIGTAAQSSSYTYDANGNLKSDSKKGITINYNVLNLPEKITKTATGENLIYTYDASGRKLRKVLGSTTRDYIGGIEYNGSAIDFIQTEEGRAIPGTAYSYEYMLKDHLGNTRAAVKQDGSIVQVQDYYAFGMQMNPGNAYMSGTSNQYKYNGKEFQKELGLDEYDYGARFYDPVLGRWTAPDMLAELAPNLTPYRYCFNNPVLYIDPYGLWETTSGGYTTNKKEDIERFLAMMDIEKNDLKNNPDMAQMAGFIDREMAGGLGVLSDGSKLATGFTINAYRQVGGGIKGYAEQKSFSNFWHSVQGDLTPDALDPRTLHNNLAGMSYPGPNNPKKYNGQDDYSYFPADIVEYPAILHDMRYDALKIRGKNGLFKDKRAIPADDEFIINQMYISSMATDPLTRLKAFGLGAGLWYLSTDKRDNGSWLPKSVNQKK